MKFYKLSTNRDLITNKISIDGDTISIDIKDNTQADGIGVTSANGTFSLSDLITKFSQDHGCIALFPKNMYSNESSAMIALETTQLSLPEKSASGESFVSEQTTPGKHLSGSPFSVIAGRYGSYGYVYILTPYANCSVDDLEIVIREHNAEIKVNGTDATATTIPSMKEYLDQWLPITIEGPDTIQANQVQQYTATAPNNTTVYLESDIGVINRSRVASGGMFQLDASGLSAGEKIRIKTGYKFWHGVSEKVITVV